MSIEKLFRKSQQAFRSLEANDNIEVTVVKATVDYVYAVIQQYEGENAARQFIDDLRQWGWLPQGYIVIDRDVRNALEHAEYIWLRELTAAPQNTLQILTHFPSQYTLWVQDIAAASCNVLTPDELLQRTDFEKLLPKDILMEAEASRQAEPDFTHQSSTEFIIQWAPELIESFEDWEEPPIPSSGKERLQSLPHDKEDWTRQSANTLLLFYLLSEFLNQVLDFNGLLNVSLSSLPLRGAPESTVLSLPKDNAPDVEKDYSKTGGRGSSLGDEHSDLGDRTDLGKKIVVVNNSTGNHTVTVETGESLVIEDFGGVGQGTKLLELVISEVDTLKVEGADLTAQNMVLTQEGNDLVVAFEEVANTKVTLKDLTLENLDSFFIDVGGRRIPLDNALFDGQNSLQDSFDIFNAEWTRDEVLGTNTVTSLNSLDNDVKGFNNSADVINGQDGDNTLQGLSGDNILRGESGNDTLLGGSSDDRLVGGNGDDLLDGGTGENVLNGGSGGDRFMLNSNGISVVEDFQMGSDRIVLPMDTSHKQLSIRQEGNSTVVEFNNRPLAFLLGVQYTTLIERGIT
ncbi:hypothetical protein H6G89_29080 [Oscillatoria sp. FACHB-1407]|uniref:calcium-binding protein n=1 Tax=Oscillatoria sp. FACHB-1407 TaxID=2692847 RepID=UPI001686A256|nr:calcium-binding protein [Oscillatoria sp. FACHB-1407]MBD2465065.1 hypothetical protein [Oscillatoria sp. FACHB-1407]